VTLWSAGPSGLCGMYSAQVWLIQGNWTGYIVQCFREASTLADLTVLNRIYSEMPQLTEVHWVEYILVSCS
jgi:hypothetical protein